MDAELLLETPRELHSRVNDRIHVRLLWFERADRVFVEVDDAKTGERFLVHVTERSRAMHVFHHPYAYPAYAPDGSMSASSDAPHWAGPPNAEPLDASTL